MIEYNEPWLITFIKKHTARGSHRWAFWLEGVVIGLLICYFWI
jgi:hypothetical protein